jgi:DUF971 family protein
VTLSSRSYILLISRRECFGHSFRLLSILFQHVWKQRRSPAYLKNAARMLCDTEFMAVAADPKSVKVNLSTGTGLDIEWKDGHRSHYSFPFLRDACPCALCDEARSKKHQRPGEPPKLAAGALPMFKPAVKATSADGVGKYAIKFHFNDGHELGIYSWQFLRDWCPCEECKAARATHAGAHP